VTRPRTRTRSERGQALVEFGFAIMIFLTIFIAMLDLARGVFMYNGVSQAAREIARETSVHSGAGLLGASPEAQTALAVQQSLVPGLGTPTYECVDIAGAVQFDTCLPGDWVRVTATTQFYPVLPFLTAMGPFHFSSVSSAEIQ